MKICDILLEYDHAKTLQAYGAKLGPDAEQILNKIEAVDPTANKEYSQSLAKMYSQGGLTDAQLTADLTQLLTKFHELKKRNLLPAELKDFNRNKTIDQFATAVKDLPDPSEVATKKDRKDDQDKGQVEVIADTGEVRVVQLGNEAAAKYYGQGSKWCTSGDENNWFNNYLPYGPIWTFLPKNPQYPGEKYQAFLANNDNLNYASEFRDETDTMVGPDAIESRFPDFISSLTPEQEALWLEAVDVYLGSTQGADEEEPFFGDEADEEEQWEEAYVNLRGVDSSTIHGDTLVINVTGGITTNRSASTYFSELFRNDPISFSSLADSTYADPMGLAYIVMQNDAEVNETPDVAIVVFTKDDGARYLTWDSISDDKVKQVGWDLWGSLKKDLDDYREKKASTLAVSNSYKQALDKIYNKWGPPPKENPNKFDHDEEEELTPKRAKTIVTKALGRDPEFSKAVAKLNDQRRKEFDNNIVDVAKDVLNGMWGEEIAKKWGRAGKGFFSESKELDRIKYLIDYK